jgi:hypothetical protein
MSKRKFVGGVIGTIVALLAAGIAFAATIDPVNRTVTTDVFFVDWGETNPEEIVDIRWNGSPNLTKTAVIGGCPDDLEYFGNSWAAQDAQGSSTFRSLVGWGTTGEWENRGSKKIKIQSSSADCPGSVDIPVKTDYQFFDRGPRVNTIRVQRSFSFGSTPFLFNFRPYIPRVFPSDAFTEVLHPDASGASLLTENIGPCHFGCEVTDWNGEWFAIHDPSSGQGLIVNRKSSRFAAVLWIDQDGASFANTTSALLIQPTGGFTGKVVEKESLCFYDSSIWTPSTVLPPVC